MGLIGGGCLASGGLILVGTKSSGHRLATHSRGTAGVKGMKAQALAGSH